MVKPQTEPSAICYNRGMTFRTLFFGLGILCTALARAQYQDYSRMGKTPAELQFIEDPMAIEVKEPSWFWHNPKKNTPAEQLAYAAELEHDGQRDKAIEAYDDLVHEWHATPEALTAQLAIARLESAAGHARAAFDADVYLLAYFAGRFELEPILEDATAQADLMVAREANRTLHFQAGSGLRRNYEKIIHFAPRWRKVPELLLKIAALYAQDGEYASAITVCDRILADWPTYEKLDDVVYAYCDACRKQADKWRNDTGRLRHLERLLAGAQTFRPGHPDSARFARWQQEVYLLRRNRSYAKATFYDNPNAYSVEAALLAYQTFLREFPDAPEAERVRARLAELSLAQKQAPQGETK